MSTHETKETQQSPRDRVVVTGMGFCLPGPGTATCTSKDAWQQMSTGAVNLDHHGRFFGVVPGDVRDLVSERCPDLKARYLDKYNHAQHYGLVSMLEALAQAELTPTSPELSGAAVLTGRHGLDEPVVAYSNALAADSSTTAEAARDLIARTMLAGNTMDVFLAQATLLSSTGPAFTLSASCATTGILIGSALQLIRTGESDLVVVTGADHYDPGRMAHFQELAKTAVADLDGSFTGVVDALQMRPYDRAPGGPNVGNGAATIILERETSARERGAAPLSRITAQSTRRGPLRSAMAVDLKGWGAVAAARRCLAVAGANPDQVDYINGGAEGDLSLQKMEFHALREVFGERAATLPVSSQEACFGHSGAPLGVLGVAATTMMLQRQQLCPTAGCREVDPDCTFDVVTGDAPRDADLRYALSFNYGTGMVSSAVLVEAL